LLEEAGSVRGRFCGREKESNAAVEESNEAVEESKLEVAASVVDGAWGTVDVVVCTVGREAGSDVIGTVGAREGSANG
jgi:hypothetical protein